MGLAAWVGRHDREGRLRLVAYQDAAISDALRSACARALHVVAPDGETTSGGRAVITVVQQLGHARLARLLARRPLVWLVELGYRLIATGRRYVA